MLKKIVLEIDGKKIELTPEQAKALKAELEALFNGAEKVYLPLPYEVTPQVWRPYWPYGITTTGTNTSVDRGTYTICVN